MQVTLLLLQLGPWLYGRLLRSNLPMAASRVQSVVNIQVRFGRVVTWVRCIRFVLPTTAPMFHVCLGVPLFPFLTLSPSTALSPLSLTVCLHVFRLFSPRTAG